MDRLTNLRTDTAIIGNNKLHLMHSMQPKMLQVHDSQLYVHCQRRNTATTIARLGHCVDDICHWMDGSKSFADEPC